jgi:hypothetical protein
MKKITENDWLIIGVIIFCGLIIYIGLETILRYFLG